MTSRVGASTMRALVQHGYGNADVLSLATVPRPAVADDEILIRVRAAGLDRGTEHLMTGKPYAVRLASGLRRPRQPVLGRDVAGIVAAVGSAVTRFAVGDEVYGVAPGSFAEYAVARERQLARKPSNLSYAQAAVVPVSAATALRAVHDLGRLAEGQSVLVTGASGGVGGYAVQLAKAFGGEVTGACSTAKLDFVSSLGADHVVDYTRQDFAEGSRLYDLIIDVAGNPSLRRLQRALTPRGTAIFVGGESAGSLAGMSRQLHGVLVSPFLRQRFALLFPRESAQDYKRLTNMIERGSITPCLDVAYPLEDGVEAVRYLESGTVRGKVAITV